MGLVNAFGGVVMSLTRVEVHSEYTLDDAVDAKSEDSRENSFFL